MNITEVPTLYKKYFIDKSDERTMLFEKIAALYNPQNGIYPGSFVHITPSFFIQNMIYIDSDRRITKFYEKENLIDFIKERKVYASEPSFQGFQADYSKKLPI